MRLGFRRLLPVLLTVTYVLLLVAIEHQPQRPAAYETEYDPGISPPPTAADLAEVILYLPALIAAAPITWVFNIRLSLAAIPFVPVLWWLVGYWLDIKFGFVAAKPKRFSPVRTAGRVLAALVSGLLLLLFIWLLLAYLDPNGPWFAAPGVFWFGWMFIVSVYRPRHRQA